MGQDDKGQGFKKGQARKKLYFKFFVESWLWGSSRTELKPDERSVWVDFLSLAASNFGDIVISSRRQLARQLLISMKLLNKSIDNFIKFGKVVPGSHDGKELLRIANWNEYQGEYLKKPKKEAEKHDTGFSTKGDIGKEIVNIKGIKEEGQDKNPPKDPSASATGSGGPTEKDGSLRGSGPPLSDGQESPLITEIIGLLKDSGIGELGDLEPGFAEFARRSVREFGQDARSAAAGSIAAMKAHPDWVSVPKEGSEAERLWRAFCSVDEKLADQPEVSAKESMRAEFLGILRSCPGYPFDETWDSPFFEDEYEKHHARVNLILKTRKKVEFWRGHPNALQGRKSPQDQLSEFFAGDFGNKNNRGEHGTNA